MNDHDAQSRLQWAEAAQWFAKADEDIQVTELVLAADPPLLDPAAFHCQQAAEKIIKGLLVGAAVKIPRIHDLEALAGLAGPYYPHLVQIMEKIAPASAWISRTRYPGLTEGVGADEGEIAEMLELIKVFRIETGTGRM